MKHLSIISIALITLLTILSIFSISTINLAFAQYDNSECTTSSPINFQTTKNKYLSKLSKYQDICKSSVVKQLMFFVPTPSEYTSTLEISYELFSNISAFSKHNIRPLIVMEPTFYYGTLMSFQELKTGKFNKWINFLFERLTLMNISEDELGTIVLMPEVNTPLWNYDGASKQDVGLIVNNYSSQILKNYPKAKLTLMLNNLTFDPGDENWENPTNSPFTEYTKLITPNTLYSVGLQAFPMIGPKNNSKLNIKDPDEYLNIVNIEELAQALNVKSIWFNTGSFVSKYLNPQKRQLIDANQVIDQVKKTSTIAYQLKRKGYEMNINYFLEDKSKTKEETNWSLLDSKFSEAFRTLVKHNNARVIGLSIFDK